MLTTPELLLAGCAIVIALVTIALVIRAQPPHLPTPSLPDVLREIASPRAAARRRWDWDADADLTHIDW